MACSNKQVEFLASVGAESESIIRTRTDQANKDKDATMNPQGADSEATLRGRSEAVVAAYVLGVVSPDELGAGKLDPSTVEAVNAFVVGTFGASYPNGKGEIPESMPKGENALRILARIGRALALRETGAVATRLSVKKGPKGFSVNKVDAESLETLTAFLVTDWEIDGKKVAKKGNSRGKRNVWAANKGWDDAFRSACVKARSDGGSLADATAILSEAFESIAVADVMDVATLAA